MKSPSALRKTKKEMKSYRQELVALMPHVSKKTIEGILTLYFVKACAGRRHAMAQKMHFVRRAAVDIKPCKLMGPVAIQTALDKRVAELETDDWASRGIIETYSPEQKQRESHTVQSFSAKGGMRCT